MKKVIWLTSYPKSGNTWMRAFLTSLLKEENDNTINNLLAPIVSQRSIIEDFLMLETSELTNDEVEKYLPYALKSFADEQDTVPYYMKVHDAYTLTSENIPLFPADISIGAIYIVRNPLDVVPSFAHHNSDTIEYTISVLKNSRSCFCDNVKTIKTQLRQKLLSWSGHVLSWVEQEDMPVLLVRYEDMFTRPLETFREVVQFSGINATDEMILAAIKNVSFENLKTQEQEFGFTNKRPGTKSFFRKGKIGSWRESLTSEQAAEVIAEHKMVMDRLGYLDAAGNPVY
jgi:hypothetical protein